MKIVYASFEDSMQQTGWRTGSCWGTPVSLSLELGSASRWCASTALWLLNWRSLTSIQLRVQVEWARVCCFHLS